MAQGLWGSWKRLVQRAATFQARLLLTVFYWIVLAPLAVLSAPFADPLRLRGTDGGRWTACGRVDPRRQH